MRHRATQRLMIAISTSLLLAVMLGSCSSMPLAQSNSRAKSVAVPTQAGQFVSARFIRTVSSDAVLDAIPEAIQRSVRPRYDVDAYKIVYSTVDMQGRIVLASGLAAHPRKSFASPGPVMSYQHATIKFDAEAPSNYAKQDDPAILYASLGYMVIAADYVGYGSSKGAPHPYVLAEPTAAAVTDFIQASAQWRESLGIGDNGQLFFTGYSQGAYASIAALRSMTMQGVPSAALPTATFVGAGPYDIVRTLDTMMSGILEKHPTVGSALQPEFLQHTGELSRVLVRKLMLAAALGNKSDIRFDPTFLDSYLDGDKTRLTALSSVVDWTPRSPVTFFHGRDDRTVPYVNTDAIIHAMQERGAGKLIKRIDCSAEVSGHIPCVPEFLQLSIQRLGRIATDL
jgi:pimeloyl-ACP methyl ester carboxylesterase